MPKRGDRVAPPAAPEQWELRFGDGDAADGWEDLCKQAPGPTRAAYDAIARSPRDSTQPGRQHRLKGQLGTRQVAGKQLEQWQFEVTGAGRVWYCIDDERRRVVLTLATTRHPKQTE